MKPHKHWRFVILETNGATITRFQNFAFSTYALGLDLCDVQNGKWATFTHQGIEGDVYQRDWSADLQVKGSQVQIAVEFHEPELVGAYSFKAEGASAPKKWRIEFSDNGDVWHIAHLVYCWGNWFGQTQSFNVELFELVIDLNGSNAAVGFFAFAHDLDGQLLLKQRVFNGKNKLLMPNSQPISVTVVQDFGKPFQLLSYYNEGDLVFPSNPTEKPYYFRNRKAGVSGEFEPDWSTDPLEVNHTGGCIFEMVERFTYPICHQPLIPQKIYDSESF